ncbi:HEPN domain-containing protein [Pseudomonas aeruginosa]|uniref:HEPN domain-containing protein n=1 Tax=Pseudomonas aeruginosa TaxID=287 RepID=UPI003BFF3026
MSEFSLNFDDFSSELDALSEVVTGPTEGASHTLSPRARICAGNAATLMLAAIYEEYIRQQVISAFKEKCSRVNGYTDLPKSLAGKVWKKALDNMARTQFSRIEERSRETEENIRNILNFTLRKDLRSDVSKTVAHNVNNMRPQQMAELFKDIGISEIINKSCNEHSLKILIGASKKAELVSTVTLRLDDFFQRRNDMAHALQAGRSSGPGEILQDIELFRLFGKGLASALDREFPALEREGLEA